VGKMWGYEPRYVGSLWKLKRERKQSHWNTQEEYSPTDAWF
jgi:hypothetical protein